MLTTGIPLARSRLGGFGSPVKALAPQERRRAPGGQILDYAAEAA